MNTRKSTFTLLVSWILLCMLLITSCAPSTEPKTNLPKKESHVNTVFPIERDHVVLYEDLSGGYVDNIIVLLVKEGVEEKQVLSWFPGEDASIAGSFPGIRQLQVKIKPRSEKELEALASELMKKEEVLYAHVELAGSLLEQSKEEDQEPPAPPKKPDNEWWYDAVGLNQARQYLKTKDLVKVGVLDDGFDPTHPDLKLIFPNEEQEKLNNPQDHGTHVAGIVQQILPDAQITVNNTIRTPSEDPATHVATQCQFMKNLVDMVEAGVKVLNYSMGGDIEDENELLWNLKSSTIYSVYIWQLQQQGNQFMVVQSAGNAGIDAYRNGMFASINEENCLGSDEVHKSLGVSDKLKEAKQSVLDSIVIVAATEKKSSAGQYYLSEGTNYGNIVSIAAPGIEINSTVPGGYLRMGGTSQATPIISGSLGFLWSINKNLTPKELKKLLISSATEFALDPAKKEGDNRREKYPFINLLEAVIKIQSNN